jgi:hypothetical protein
MSKQEIWQWVPIEGTCFGKLHLRLSTDAKFDPFAATAYDSGNWYVWAYPRRVGGKRQTFAMGQCKTQELAVRRASIEIKRQLASHGIRVEIRRVSK